MKPVTASELVNDAVEKGNRIDANGTSITQRVSGEPSDRQNADDLRRLRRQAEVEQLIAEIERLFRAGEPEQAARKIETALRDNTGEPRLATLAQQIADEQRRCQEVQIQQRAVSWNKTMPKLPFKSSLVH
jgi:uncharacterized protein HemY